MAWSVDTKYFQSQLVLAFFYKNRHTHFWPELDSADVLFGKLERGWNMQKGDGIVNGLCVFLTVVFCELVLETWRYVIQTGQICISSFIFEFASATC